MLWVLQHKRVLLRRGCEKAVSRRCPERPLGEYYPLGVRTKIGDGPNRVSESTVPNTELSEFILPSSNSGQRPPKLSRLSLYAVILSGQAKGG